MLSLVKLTRPSATRDRQFTLDAVRQFQEAQKKLEERCAELGIPVPVLVC